MTGLTGGEGVARGRAVPEADPGERRWLAGYEATRGHVDRAREGWSAVVEAARGSPALALGCGAALASVLLEPLGLPTFGVLFVGGTLEERTAAVEVSIAVAGDPAGLLVEADEGTVRRRTELAGILPVAIRPDATARVVAAALDARGSASSVIAGAAGTMPARRELVDVEIVAGEVAGRIDVVRGLAGWPLSWLAWSPVIEQASGWYERTLAALAAPARAAGASAEPLAVSAVGFGLLAWLTGAADAGFAGVVPALQALERRPPPLD